MLLRKDWIAAIAFVALFALPRGLTSTHVAIELPTEILVYAIAVLIVFRFGLIPLAVAIFTINMIANLPLTSDFSAWYFVKPMSRAAECSRPRGLGASITHLAANRCGRSRWSSAPPRPPRLVFPCFTRRIR